MSYDVSNIININTNISAAGLGFANFGAAAIFPLAAEVTASSQTPGAFKTYSDPADLVTDGFPTTSETYKIAVKWLGGIPSSQSIIVYFTDVVGNEPTLTDTLNNARNLFFWYWGFFDKSIYDDITLVSGDVILAATHAELNTWYFMNCQGDSANVAAIRTEATTNDIASELTSQGRRHNSTHAHATDPYAGVALAKWYASVNYANIKSTITGEGKKLSGVVAESLPTTEYTAMNQDTKKCNFYTVVDLQGSTDLGRSVNTRSHSTFGEWIDDVVNLDAFVNTLQVILFNTVENQTTKLPQDPVGQSVILGEAKAVCEQYIANNYLGPRNYIDPDDGIEKFTLGYEILTKPEDILDISDPARADRESAAVRIRIFRAGAIQFVDVTVDVF